MAHYIPPHANRFLEDAKLSCLLQVVAVFTASKLHSTRCRWLEETWGKDVPNLVYLTVSLIGSLASG
eukprot:COSAG02_NODE_22_length_53020_cov_16.223125_4_plen_67_part_00